MDPQLFELLVARFDKQDQMLEDINKNLREHTEKDEQYWTKIDVTEGQVDLLKWLFGGFSITTIGSAIAWVITNIKG